MSFHTKTIGRILDPVAQQVSKLILLFEDGGTAGETPDLANRVAVVKMAVDNLVKVGYDTIRQSPDQLLKQDMPPALVRVEEASVFLQEAVKLLSQDPSSKIGRKKLIDGSRGILQGTLLVLVTFDVSEVRKIVDCCTRVLSMLNIVPNISSFPQLVDFVKNLTPEMAEMIKEVDGRQEELVITSHVELLQRGISQVKRITPILISSVKLFLNTIQQGLPASDEAQANRNYFLRQMSDEINEIIRVLQLTSSDDTDYLGEQFGLQMIDKNGKFAQQWFDNPSDPTGVEVVRQILDNARQFDALCMSDAERNGLRGLINALESRVTQIVQAKQQQGSGSSPSGSLRSLCAASRDDLGRLLELCRALCERSENQSAIYRLARTLEGKVAQTRRWLTLEPRAPQLLQLGHEAAHALIGQATRLVDDDDDDDNDYGGDNGSGLGDDGSAKQFHQCCDRLRTQVDQLYGMVDKPLISEKQARQERELATQTAQTLEVMWQSLQGRIVRQVADYFTDLVGPVKHLHDVATTTASDEDAYQRAESDFLEHSRRARRTASLVGAAVAGTANCGSRGVGDRSDALHALAANLEGVGSQVSRASRAVVSARRTGASSQLQSAAVDHFDLVRRHWTECAERARDMIDETIDVGAFVHIQEAAIARENARVEAMVQQQRLLQQQGSPSTMDSAAVVVNSTTAVALRANRVLQMGIRETENSEDATYVANVGAALQRLRSAIPPVVADAKNMVLSMDDSGRCDKWRGSSRALVDAVSNVGRHVCPIRRGGGGGRAAARDAHHQFLQRNTGDLPITEMQRLSVNAAPPGSSSTNDGGVCGDSSNSSTTPATYRISVRNKHHRYQHPIITGPYSPYGDHLRTTSSQSDDDSSRPLSPESDAEEEFNYPPPENNQPILAAAHALHQEARLWSSRDNELIAATKRIAALMAELSQIVRGEQGNKKDLINVSMAIAEASIDVTKCAKALGHECTDRRMKSNLFQLSERILMIGNQLKILSTVKATMLGSDGKPISSEFNESDSPEDQENTEVLVGNAQNLMQAVIETVRVAEGASIKVRVDSGYRIRWMPRPISNGQNYAY